MNVQHLLCHCGESFTPADEILVMLRIHMKVFIFFFRKKNLSMKKLRGVSEQNRLSNEVSIVKVNCKVFNSTQLELN